MLQGDILPLVHKVCDGSFLEVVAAMMSDEFRCDSSLARKTSVTEGKQANLRWRSSLG